jgi:CO/xanthine dehydrogenase FAD-binding subunit
MIPNNFDYFAPKTIEEALQLLEQHGEDAKILSGGHSLIPVLKLRLASPGVVIDIGRRAPLQPLEELLLREALLRPEHGVDDHRQRHRSPSTVAAEGTLHGRRHPWQV